MKKYILIIFCSLISGLTLTAQNIDEGKIPEAVVKTFRSKFPKVEGQKWSKMKDGNYVVSLMNAGAPSSMTINKEGKMIELTRNIPANAMTLEAQASIKKNFSDYSIDLVDKVNDENANVNYRIKLKKDNSYVTIMMDRLGVVISKNTPDKTADKKSKERP